MDIKENFKGHLSTINHHKMEVMRLCFKVGLYAQVLSEYEDSYIISVYNAEEQTVTKEKVAKSDILGE